jgi:hypothetical protein
MSGIPALRETGRRILIFEAILGYIAPVTRKMQAVPDSTMSSPVM